MNQVITNELITQVLQFIIFLENWPISDDTILHLANAEWLIETSTSQNIKHSFLSLIKYYKNAINTENHEKRCFGRTTVDSIKKLLNENDESGYRIPFNLKYFLYTRALINFLYCTILVECKCIELVALT